MFRKIPDELDAVADQTGVSGGVSVVQSGCLGARRGVRTRARIDRCSSRPDGNHATSGPVLARRCGVFVDAVARALVRRLDPLLCVVGPVERSLDGLFEVRVDLQPVVVTRHACGHSRLRWRQRTQQFDVGARAARRGQTARRQPVPAWSRLQPRAQARPARCAAPQRVIRRPARVQPARSAVQARRAQHDRFRPWPLARLRRHHPAAPAHPPPPQATPGRSRAGPNSGRANEDACCDVSNDSRLCSASWQAASADNPAFPD